MAMILRQTLDLSAALLTVSVGTIHSVLGELLIFAPLRRATLAPLATPATIPRGHMGILWASWHLATVFGLAQAGLLAWLALRPQPRADSVLLGGLVAVAMGLGSGFVCLATAGRHPGWIGLAAVAVLSVAALMC